MSEVDRPGSFAAHCGKALTLLLDVLKSIPDVDTLVDINPKEIADTYRKATHLGRC